MLAVVVLALGALQASDSDHHPVVPAAPATPGYGIGAAHPDPPNAPVTLGDAAPDFSFEAPDHSWQRLHDLLAQGSVLLVFAPDTPRLVSLEREHQAMMERGIVPVAVLDRSERATQSTVHRLGLGYPVLADPRGVIADQFNQVDLAGPRTLPGWFMIDRDGQVRGLHREGLPQGGFIAIATRALGLPTDGVVLPSSSD
jgi:peroxiredoxin